MEQEARDEFHVAVARARAAMLAKLEALEKTCRAIPTSHQIILLDDMNSVGRDTLDVEE